MTDDSFIREVNEELRSERAKAIWRRFGPFIIGAAIAVVLGTAANVAYNHWTSTQAAASGDEFLAALDLAAAGKNDEALTVLEKLQASGYGSYPALAQMRSASILASKGDKVGAVAAYDKAAADQSVPAPLRDMAKIHAAYILLDTGSYDDVAKRVEVLSSDSHPMRHSAREAMGMAAWKAEKNDDAAKLFKQVADDPLAPANIRQRAHIMLELMRGNGSIAVQ